MTVEEISKLINKKIAENPNKVVIKYFEMKIERNLSNTELLAILNIIRNILNSLGYKVFSDGNEYNYDDKKCIVKTNELMVGIKEK